MGGDLEATSWWAEGLLFENCSCQVVCPGHVHFDQNCTLERCVGYWAIRFDDGQFGDVGLRGCKAVIAYESPQHMIDGDWTEVIIIDRASSDEERHAVEAILSGRAGGPWEILARFVSKRLQTTFLPIHIEDADRTKRVRIGEVLDSTIDAIRGRDRAHPVTFENMFNQIHDASQVIARGSATYDDGHIIFDTKGTHALYSAFHWST